MLLIRKEDNLIEDHALSSWNAVNKAHKVNWHGDIVYLDICVWLYQTRNNYAIYIDKAIDFHLSLANANLVVCDLEIVKTDMFVCEVLDKETLDKVSCFILAKKT